MTSHSRHSVTAVTALPHRFRPDDASAPCSTVDGAEVTSAVPELLTVPQVMARLNVGRTKVYDLIRTHRLVSIKVDGCRRIPVHAVHEFITGRIGEAA